MSQKKTRQEDHVISSTEEETAPVVERAPAVSDADNSPEQKVQDNPDKPDEASIAQVEVVDKPEDQHA